MTPGRQASSGKRTRGKAQGTGLERMAVELGASGARPLKPDQVVLGEWVRLKCQYGCPHFGKKLTCPPFTPSIDQMRRLLSEYKNILLVRFDQPPIASEKDSDGLLRQLGERQNNINTIALRIEKQLFEKGYYKAFAIGPTTCSRCDECNTKPGGCRYPTEPRPPPESLSVDMFSTVRNSGWEIAVKTDTFQSWSYYAIILIE